MLFYPIRKITIAQLRIRIRLHINIMLTVHTGRKFLNQCRHVGVLDFVSKIIAVDLVVGALVMDVQQRLVGFVETGCGFEAA